MTRHTPHLLLAVIGFTAFMVAQMAYTPTAHAQLFGTPSPESQVEYLPTRAFVPTIDQIKPLAEQAYSMGMYYDSLRYFQRLDAINPEQSQLGIAKSFERMGEYAKALGALQELPLADSAFREQARRLRASLLLSMAEVHQKTNDLKASENYLRTFVSEYKDELNNRRYIHLMRQQAVLSGSLIPDALKASEQTIPLRVGLLLPLSGPMAEIGQSMQQAALISLFNQSMKHIELYPEDTQGTPAGAQAALERALQSGVDIVLGPLLSQNVQAITPMADAADRPVIAYSSDRMVADGRDVRLFSIIPTEQAELVARYAVQHGYRSFAALMPEGPYGREMFRVFEAEVKRLGGTLDRHSFYDAKSPDITTSLKYITRIEEARAELNKELRALEKQYELLADAMDDESLARLRELRKAEPQPIVNYQALFVPAPAKTLSLIASQLAFYDTDGSQVKLLGSSQWDSPELLANADRYVWGSWYPALAKGNEFVFEQQYKAIYGQQPHPLAALAYDSIQLLSNFAENGLTRGNELDRMVRQSGGFYGVTGPYRFNLQGTLEHGYSLNQIGYRRGQARNIELVPSPTILPAAEAPLEPQYTDKRFREPEPPRRKSRGFFESLFGN